MSNPLPRMASDLEIARTAKLKPISDVARDLGLEDEEIIPYGATKAKIHLDALRRIDGNPMGKYVVVTAVTPTPLGEGKTTTTVGLIQGLESSGRRSIACIRQPSMGPTFGIKGAPPAAGTARWSPWKSSTSI